jgi:hypothetical protein
MKLIPCFSKFTLQSFFASDISILHLNKYDKSFPTLLEKYHAHHLIQYKDPTNYFLGKYPDKSH